MSNYTLITGASSGIGQGIARKLSQERCLILHGRDINRIQATRDLCKNNGSHLLWQCDLNHVSEIENSFEEFLSNHSEYVKGIECFIHSAGIVKIRPVRLIDYKISQEIVNVNFLSAAEIIRILLKISRCSLKKIVFISSAASKLGEKGNSIYCASKGALDSFARSLAVELAPAIKVHSLLFGLISTRMSEKTIANESLKKDIEEKYPSGIGTIEDAVNAVEFIVSPKGRWLTGSRLFIDGGRSIL